MKASVGLACLGVVVASCGTEGSGGVTDPGDRVHAIEIAPETASFGAVGSTVQFEATVLDASGASLAGVPVIWSTAGSGVIEVDASGLVTSLGDGTERLRATVGSTEAEVEIVVEQIPVSLTSDASTVELDRIGATMALGPFAVDSNGVAVTAPGAFSYTSTDPGTVSVDDDGVVKANYFGDAEITVARMDLLTTVTVRVEATGRYEAVLGAALPCEGGRAGSFPCDRVDLVAFLPLAGLGAGPETRLNDLWGWRDSLSMREYALVGRDDGITFVDVTEPLFPRAVGHLPASNQPSTWRDVKVYRDHAYVVADAAPAHGMQVFDLTRLRATSKYTVFTEDARYFDIGNARNLTINEDTGYGYVVGSNIDVRECDGGLHMVDLATPMHPVFAGCFADSRVGTAGMGYTQDVQCVVYRGPDPDYSGREICIGSGETALYLVDVTDKAAVTPIAVAAYPGVGYVYQGWLSEDHTYFFQSDSGDELQSLSDPPTRTRVWDLSDLDEPFLVGTLQGPSTATDFNLFVFDDRLFISNGAFGVRIVDVTDPVSAVEVGFFDTFPGGDRASEDDGSWSNYPFLGAGRVIVTSREEGMFILEPRG